MESYNKTMWELIQCGWHQHRIDFYERFSWWMEGFSSITIGVLGIIFNTITICILCNKRIGANLFNRLLMALAIIDNLFLLVRIVISLTNQMTEPLSFHHLNIFVNFLYPMQSILMCSSIYITVALSFERYTFLKKPILNRTRHNTDSATRVVLYVTSIIMFSCLFYIPRFLENTISETSPKCKEGFEASDNLSKELNSSCSVTFEFVPTELRMDRNYVLWYINISNLVVTSFIPGVLLMFFNLNIYRLLKRSKLHRASMRLEQGILNQTEKNTDTRRTFVLFAIVTLFLACHSLRVILNIEEAYNKANREEYEQCPLRYWAVLTIPISAVLIHINASAIFFVYCFFDPVFRKVLISQCLRRGLDDENMRQTFGQINENMKKTIETIRLQEIREDI